jgi:plasmid stabilization system protein ParE
MAFPENVIWSPSARADIENISEYIKYEWGNNVLSRFLLKVNWIINQIVINPKQYPVVNSKLKIRKCVITKQNTLYYRLLNGNIEIVRIYDTRQDPGKLKILFKTN